MPRRSSPHSVEDLSDLSALDTLVVDKRQGQRATAKKNRRNRHYEKLLLRHSITHGLALSDEPAAAEREDGHA